MRALVLAATMAACARPLPSRPDPKYLAGPGLMRLTPSYVSGATWNVLLGGEPLACDTQQVLPAFGCARPLEVYYDGCHWICSEELPPDARQ